MALESFNLKSLFVNDEANQTSQNAPKEQIKTTTITENKFPTTESKFPETPINSGTNSNSFGNNSDNPFLNEILEVYNKGFESLNQSGFDFFEMYKSVMAVGPTNPQSYQMAFTMGKTIKSDLSKTFLLEKSIYQDFNNRVEAILQETQNQEWANTSDFEDVLEKLKF